MNTLIDLLRQRANARNVSFRISLRWLTYIVNSVDKTKLPEKQAYSFPVLSRFRNGLLNGYRHLPASISVKLPAQTEANDEEPANRSAIQD